MSGLNPSGNRRKSKETGGKSRKKRKYQAVSGRNPELLPNYFFNLSAVFDDLRVGYFPGLGQLCISGSTSSAASELQHGLVNGLQSRCQASLNFTESEDIIRKVCAEGIL